jgi:hypothetical protein
MSYTLLFLTVSKTINPYGLMDGSIEKKKEINNVLNNHKSWNHKPKPQSAHVG